ncbi:MAG: hypothetical protein WC438_02265 [Candidatus Pacearchaeota archaeon]
MKIANSESKIPIGTEFLRMSIAGNNHEIYLEYATRDNIYVRESFRVAHPLNPNFLYLEDFTGQFSFSEIKKMPYVLMVTRERQYANSKLDKLDEITEREAIYERLPRKQAIQKRKQLIQERIKKYLELTPIKIISINPRDKEFLKDLIPSQN